MLECLLTDAWIAPGSLLGKLCGRRSKLIQRFHTELHGARVEAFTRSSILFETVARPRGLSVWPSILARNHWFQRKVVSFLRSQPSTINYQPILLSYSYTALEPFRYAKAHGWKTLLVQIDPGPEEERIVAEEAARVPELAGHWQPAPPEYWSNWRKECKLADRIVVNSEWSREALIRGGVAPDKLSIIPLAYEPGVGSGRFTEPQLQRRYPARFTQERPLRVLFLGLVNLRKGVARLLEAARIVRNEPVEFWMVGPVELTNASTITDGGRVKWFAPVRHDQATGFYRDADVFILPTLSDGFAITQLEAQADGLPVIASKTCGKVVENGVNGTILEQPTAEHIAAAVRDCIAHPTRLQEFAAASRVRDQFTTQALAQRLQELAATP
jgi:glycosyltransferase involved in cell wall biosynthesis